MLSMRGEGRNGRNLKLKWARGVEMKNPEHGPLFFPKIVFSKFYNSRKNNVEAR